MQKILKSNFLNKIKNTDFSYNYVFYFFIKIKPKFGRHCIKKNPQGGTATAATTALTARAAAPPPLRPPGS